MADFPAHPFWNYSLKLYGAPAVRDACLQLQDEFDLDVNMVLFCVWAGQAGPGELTAAELNECLARSGRWQTDVVKPIRNIRRTLKHEELGATRELIALFRPTVQAVELDAEHVEQLLLAGLVPIERGARGSAVAIANLDQYFRLTGVPTDGKSAAAVLVLLQTAFANESPEKLQSEWPKK